MYLQVLFIHSWLRWIIVISLFIVLTKALYGWAKKLDYTRFDNIMGVILLASTHLQVLVGFWLYFFLSPITTMRAPANFMKDPILRYWKVEHFFIMIVFLVLVQTGRTISRRKHIAVRKHKVIAIFSILAFALLMFGMPWPNKPYGRPLFQTKLSTSITVYNV